MNFVTKKTTDTTCFSSSNVAQFRDRLFDLYPLSYYKIVLLVYKPY